jgi:hypothetical protein
VVEVDERVAALVDAWCERRSLRSLREIPQGWPRTGGLTDDWAALADALKGVRAFAHDELTDGEADEVERLIAIVDSHVHPLHAEWHKRIGQNDSGARQGARAVSLAAYRG